MNIILKLKKKNIKWRQHTHALHASKCSFWNSLVKKNKLRDADVIRISWIQQRVCLMNLWPQVRACLGWQLHSGKDRQTDGQTSKVRLSSDSWYCCNPVWFVRISLTPQNNPSHTRQKKQTNLGSRGRQPAKQEKALPRIELALPTHEKLNTLIIHLSDDSARCLHPLQLRTEIYFEEMMCV